MHIISNFKSCEITRKNFDATNRIVNNLLYILSLTGKQNPNKTITPFYIY